MAFYKEHQVNPFGSCLPLLLQMPVFLSLFYMLRKDLKIDICHAKLEGIGAIDKAGHVLNDALLQKTACNTPAARFLFIPDITTRPPAACWSILIVLYVGSQLALERADVDVGRPQPAAADDRPAVPVHHVHHLASRPA